MDPKDFFGPQKVTPILPDFRSLKPALTHNATMADTMYDRVANAINEFEKGLASDEEVGACLAQFGQTVTIAIDSIGYHNPYLFSIYGVTSEGHRCELHQHVSQVNVLLVALKTKGEPRRIGFKLVKREDEK